MLEIGKQVYHRFLGKVTIKDINDEYVLLEELNGIKIARSDFINSMVSREEYNNADFTLKDLAKSCKIRHINCFYHITTLNNLKSILKKGIIPRRYFVQSKYDGNFFINFKEKVKIPEFPDRNRYDGKLDCSCFSVSRIDKELLKAYQMKNDYDFCAIRLSKEMVLNNYQREYFFFHNAASTEFRTHPWDYRRGQWFNKMFEKDIEVELSNVTKVFKRSSNEKVENTTSEQAEIMIRNIINPKYIEEIIFFNNEDRNKCDFKQLNINIDTSVSSAF